MIRQRSEVIDYDEVARSGVSPGVHHFAGISALNRTSRKDDVLVWLTPAAELRAGTPRRPHRGAAAAATDGCPGGSEVRLPCRHAVAFSGASERPACQLEREVRPLKQDDRLR